tara:strand:- start:1475 stop:1900 length:426 start_codon:yes stop_codon:yes gene_type:complete
MGLDRQYYDDHQQNEHFVKYYESTMYCSHGQPTYQTCYQCESQKRELTMKEWYLKQEEKFRKFIGGGFTFNQPDTREINKLNIRADELFTSLKRSKSQEELKKEYHKLALKYHPDKESGSTRIFQALNQVYTMLLDAYSTI